MTYDIFSTLRERVIAALRIIVPDLPDDVAARVEVTPTKDPAHGDMATNAAMVSAKPARMKPSDIAARLVATLAADPLVAEAASAGPGFVNLRLHEAAWRGLL
ncbi:MAG: arginine--tRNA ligase, partial [Alphaproteobacteria bacterium]|nr:arginine--tRNA ligase [Alphaproteobacteria bacterium]